MARGEPSIPVDAVASSLYIARPNGSAQFFRAADTDVARGAALVLASAAAVSGDTICYRPQATFEYSSADAKIAKDGVNWDMPQATIKYTGSSKNGIVDDGAGAITARIEVSELHYNGSVAIDPVTDFTAAVRVNNSASDITIKAHKRIGATPQVTTGGAAGAVFQTAGKLTLDCPSYESDTFALTYCVWWIAGDLHMDARPCTISGFYPMANYAPGAYATLPLVGQLWADLETIVDGVSAGISFDTNEAGASPDTYKVWLTAIGQIGNVNWAVNGRLYIERMPKGEYGLGIFRGVVWCEGQKLVANGANPWLDAEGGTIFMNFQHYAVDGFTGAALGAGFYISGNTTVHINGGVVDALGVADIDVIKTVTQGAEEENPGSPTVYLNGLKIGGPSGTGKDINNTGGTVIRDATTGATNPARVLSTSGTITKALPFDRGLPQDVRLATQNNKVATTLLTISSLTLNLEAGKSYIFDARLSLTADATAGHRAKLGGTATATSVDYTILARNNATGAVIASSHLTSMANSNDSGIVGAVGENSSGATDVGVEIKGCIVVNAAGTLLPRLGLNTGTGTTSALINSTFSCREVP